MYSYVSLYSECLNILLTGECIAGALWWRELVDLCKEVGLSGPYLVDGNIMKVEKEEHKHKELLGICLNIRKQYRQVCQVTLLQTLFKNLVRKRLNFSAIA